MKSSMTELQTRTGSPVASGGSTDLYVFPMSYAQRRLWFIDQLEPGTSTYNTPFVLRLTGQLNFQALQKSVNELLRRHEVLRANFRTVKGSPAQVINPPQEVELPLLDLSGVPDAEREQRFLETARKEADRPFNLARDRMVRTSLVRLREDEHVLLMLTHHIVTDGWSRGVVIRELSALYEAFSAGKPSPLPDLPLQYTDFAVWQNEYLQGEVLEKQLSYWKQQLADAPASLELPIDRPRPAIGTFNGATFSSSIASSLAAKLKALSQQESATLFMTLLAAFNVLLCRYTRQDDIVVGSPIANRNRAEIEPLIGFFVNTLVLRTDLSGHPSFREVLSRVRETALGAYAHQDLPFEKLVEELRPERSLSHNPLFQVLFVLQNAPREALKRSQLTMRPVDIDRRTAKFDLSLFLWEKKGELACAYEYNCDLFEPDTIARIDGHFHKLLQGIAANPDARISDYELLTDEERGRVLVELNQTATPCPVSCIHEHFEAQVLRTPDATALIAQEQRVTYADLNRRANQLAHYLRKLGVGPEVLVGICMERSPEMLVGILGILKAGGAYVPLDPAYPKDRLAFALQDCQAPVLLTQERLRDILPANDAKIVRLDADWETISGESEQNPAPQAVPTNLAYLIYTSGSTGRPKGVAIEHRSTSTFLSWAQSVFTRQELAGVLFSTSICFDLSVFEMFVPWSVGGKVILAENALELPTLAAAREVTLINTVPSAIAELLRMEGVPDSVTTVNLAGEPLPRSLVQQIYACKTIQRVYNLYGPTEDTTYSTFVLVPNDDSAVTIGRPIANTQAYILDAHLQPVPVGVPGELFLGGEGLARGYFGRPELTQEKFIPNPFSREPDARLYRTGDLARYLPDGNILFLGRIDHQVKIRGFRIELGEIESVLNQHPGVRQSLAMVREDDIGNKQIVAYLMPDAQYRIATEDSGKQPDREQVEQWETAWNETYRQVFSTSESTFNIIGWNSSYTGLPIPPEEMKEWVENTVDRIRSLRPRRVLELGCGTGLLLFRVAPHCDHYHASDFSESAVEYLRQQLAKEPGKLPSVTLSCRAADDFSGIAPGSCDVVVLNSVAQYFPSIDYLARVLESAAQVVKPGGTIFLGDIRSFPLLDAFHAAVQLHQAPASMAAAELLQRVRRRVVQEEELTIDPAFFTALQQRLPAITDVEVLVKRGNHPNEMNQFRYDVVLHVGSEAAARVDGEWLDWQKERLTLSSVQEMLEEAAPALLALTDVPNARVWTAVEALRQLSRGEAPPTVGELRNHLQDLVAHAAVEPADLWALADRLPYAVDIGWSRSGFDGCCDVIFRRNGIPRAIPRRPGEKNFLRPLETYANDPLQGVAARTLVPELRRWLSNRLPDYMVPSAFVVMDAFPLTPNGKINRRALPAPEILRQSKAVPPRDEVERLLVRIWQQLLDIPTIGVKDNFFDLGGHSLLAVRLMTEIRKATGIQIPLATLFQEATVEYLANIIRREAKPTEQMVVEIRRGGSKPPFFGIVTPGANALGYVALARHLDEDQPLYRVQAPGARLQDRPYTAKEFRDLATAYVDAMKTVQPTGPYYIGGMCEGARIAFDMACLLEARGEQVAFLGIFDTWVLENSQVRWLWKINYYGLRLKRLARLSPGDRWQALSKWAGQTLTRKKPRSLWPTAYWPGKNFVPQKFGGRITVFKRPKQPYYYVRDPFMGWGGRTTGAVEVQLIESSHRFLLREPYVQELAQKLKQHLERARTGQGQHQGPLRAQKAIAGGTPSNGRRQFDILLSSSAGTGVQREASASGTNALARKEPEPPMKSRALVHPQPFPGSYPLSAQQRRLWVLDQLEQSHGAHNVCSFLHIRGPLDRDVLEKSLNLVVSRHDILRSRFTASNGEPFQKPSDPEHVELDFEDLSTLSAAERNYRAHELGLLEAHQSFDLENGPLFRVLLLKLDNGEHRLVVVGHQIVCDSISTHLLVREIAASYEALIQGERPASSRLPVQYSEFVQWQVESSGSSAFATELDYWKQRLRGAAATELPADRARPAQQNFRGGMQSLPLDSSLVSRLMDLSRREGVALDVILCAAFLSLLARYTGSEDLVIGTEVSGRVHPPTQNTIGSFSTCLVLRADASDNPTLRDWLTRVQRVWTEAHQHETVPFGTLLETLRPVRDMSRNPLFQIMFAVSRPSEPVATPTLQFTQLHTEVATETLDLTLRVIERHEQLEARISYSTDLFDSSTIEQMLRHLQRLLQTMVEFPEKRLWDFSLLSQEEQHRILVEWNNTKVDYPRDIPLTSLIEKQVEQTPDAVALIYESEALTYRALNERANQVAHRLRRLGVGPDTLVGICAERSVEMVLALLGILKAGGAYVPLDPDYPHERLKSMMEDAAPPVVLTQAQLLDRIPQTTAEIICLDRDWHTIAGESKDNPIPLAGGDHAAYAIYTSGSTGKPKGVPNLHKAIVNRLLWMQDTYGLTSSDRVLQKTPYSFDVSVWEFFWPLMTGASLVLARPNGHKDPSYLVDLIQAQGITTLHFVPSMLGIFLETAGIEQCASMRRVFVSGEALSSELQQRFFRRLSAELHNLYGPTEAAVDVTFWRCRPDGDHATVPIGRPVANTQIYILDRTLQPVPAGVPGELHIGGIQLARGYLNRPDLTAERFIPDPFDKEPGARLYKTGDLARFLPDGNVEFLGRLDHQVKLRGFRIELGEIEAALSRSEDVRQAVVELREDTPGDKRLVAYLVPASGRSLDISRIRARLGDLLPEFMVPSKFVTLESLPTTASGKVDRKSLPAPPDQSKDRADVVAARDETESLVVSAFRTLLSVEAVSIHDDFFDLGGQSIMAARLIAHLRNVTGRQIPLSLLFREATPEYLARVLRDGIDLPPEPVAMQIQAGDAGPAFFAVVPPGENALGYAKMARYMGSRQRVYKLQGRGEVLVDRPYTHAEMQGLADEYVDAMCAVQPEGPYHFGGLCDGAHIALRMAQRLEELGQEVGILAVFDTWVLENSQRLLPWYLHYYSQRLQAFRKLPLKKKVATGFHGFRNAMKRVLPLKRHRSLWSEAYWPDEQFVPPTFSGRVTLFKRSEQPYYYVNDPEMGWGSRATGGVDVQVLPIHHAEMLHEPHVRILAQRLRECLQRFHASRAPVANHEDTAAVAVSSGAETSEDR